eukprot:5170820-Amphidinium_carterae.1
MGSTSAPELAKFSTTESADRTQGSSLPYLRLTQKVVFAVPPRCRSAFLLFRSKDEPSKSWSLSFFTFYFIMLPSSSSDFFFQVMSSSSDGKIPSE